MSEDVSLTERSKKMCPDEVALEVAQSFITTSKQRVKVWRGPYGCTSPPNAQHFQVGFLFPSFIFCMGTGSDLLDKISYDAKGA